MELLLELKASPKHQPSKNAKLSFFALEAPALQDGWRLDGKGAAEQMSRAITLTIPCGLVSEAMAGGTGNERR